MFPKNNVLVNIKWRRVDYKRTRVWRSLEYSKLYWSYGWDTHFIKKPRNSRSYYFNYKGTFRITFSALVEAAYKFIYFEVCCNGAVSNEGVFRNSSLSTAISKNIFNIPGQSRVCQNIISPYVTVAHATFSLNHTWGRHTF